MLTPRSVFAVPVLDCWLIHAPLHDLTALVNRAAVDDLAGGASPLTADLARPVHEKPRPRSGPIDPLFLGLVPTRACNMACVYCGFGALPSAEQMDPALAAAAVDWMAAHAGRMGRRTLDVHFFGGEPLAAPEVVEVAVHRTRARAAEAGLRPRLEIATNGFYSEERAVFVGDYFDVVVLSFDGFAEVQDRHRPLAPGRGSFEQVARTARRLSRSTARLCLRICVAQDNVEELAPTVDWFCSEFRPSMIDFETLQPTPESERAGLRPPDPYVFAARFFEARRRAARRGVEPMYAAAVTERPRGAFCPVGSDTLILHPDGKLSACYLLERDWQARGLDLNLGRMGSDGAPALDPEAVAATRRLAAEKPRCEACFCRWSCAGGCHVNHSYPGCPGFYDDFCIQTRLITACSLLLGLEQEAMAEALTANRPAMERLALRPGDRLEDREAAGG